MAMMVTPKTICQIEITVQFSLSCQVYLLFIKTKTMKQFRLLRGVSFMNLKKKIRNTQSPFI